MDCPVCKNAMITLELREVEVDFCTDCSGIWLDAGELEILLQDLVQAKTLLDSFKVHTAYCERPRKCPICLKKMLKIVVGNVTPPLVIDKCPKGHGLWFDKGELHQIVRKANLDRDSKIQQLLVDIFGRNGGD